MLFLVAEAVVAATGAAGGAVVVDAGGAAATVGAGVGEIGEAAVVVPTLDMLGGVEFVVAVPVESSVTAGLGAFTEPVSRVMVPVTLASETCVVVESACDELQPDSEPDAIIEVNNAPSNLFIGVTCDNSTSMIRNSDVRTTCITSTLARRYGAGESRDNE